MSSERVGTRSTAQGPVSFFDCGLVPRGGGVTSLAPLPQAALPYCCLPRVPGSPRVRSEASARWWLDLTYLVGGERPVAMASFRGGASSGATGKEEMTIKG